MKRPLFVVVPALAFCAALHSAAWRLPSGETKLKPGPGADLATANCLICHSADYISTQPPMTRTAWGAIVTKMREKYGAPLAKEKIDPIADYLAAAYGKK